MSQSSSFNTKVNQLVLGTVQLGMSYGIANKTGQPDQITTIRIIQEAWNDGIREFDTAQDYGESESVLGKAFAKLNISKEVLVISKLDPNIDHLDKHAMSGAVNRSLKRLGIPKLYGLMLHREQYISLWNQGLEKNLCSFVESGKVEYIGVSVYSPQKAIQALNMEGINFIQLPLNILDRRFEQEGFFRLAQEKKKQIYVRSVFLQGLILMSPEDIPAKMRYTRPILVQLEKLSEETGLNRQEIALGYLKLEMPEVKIIFGAELPKQVRKNVDYWSANYPLSLVPKVKSLFRDVSEQVINPVLWPK